MDDKTPFKERHQRVPPHQYEEVKKHLQVSGENANKKKNLVEWHEECQEAFEKLKQLCSKTPILAYANYRKPFKCIQMLVRMG